MKTFILSLTLLFLLIFSTLPSFAQFESNPNNIRVKVGVLAGIGSQYRNVAYNSIGSVSITQISYSPGSGLGFEAGVLFNPWKRLVFEFSSAIQFVASNQSESDYGTSNTSSVYFNRKTFLGTAKYGFVLVKKEKPWLLNIGGGIGYYLPGKLRITENNTKSKIVYNSSPGYHIVADMEIPWGPLILNPGIRYRNTSFEASHFSNGRAIHVSDDLETLKASGVDIVFAILFSL